MTESTLHNLLQQYRTPKHVLAHMRKVAAVALFLGQKLKQNGHEIDLIVLRQAALLHDILKLCDFPELDLTYFDQDVTAEDIEFWSRLVKSCHKDGHVVAAYNMLMDLGEKRLAVIVRRHGFRSLIEPVNRPETWEEKLIYYADKRVKHDQVVSAKERLRDGRERYFPDGNVPDHDPHVQEALYQLEQEICEAAHVTPEGVNEKSVADFLEPESI